MPRSDERESPAQEFSPVVGQEKASPWLLFAMPIGLGFALSIVITVINALRSIDTQAFYLGLDGLRPWLLAIAMVLVFAPIAIFYFRPKVRTLLALAGTVFVVSFAAYKTVRIESFYGNMVPRLAWRWTPTVEQQVETYLVSRQASPEGLEHAAPQELPNGFFATTSFDFARFLGSEGNGEVHGVRLLDDWSSHPPERLWQHPVGLGWSSFAVVGQAAVTLEQRGTSECVVCYNALTGQEIWVYAYERRFEDEHGDGPRTAPTIAYNRVYALGADGLLSCLDFESGTLIWKHDILLEANAENLLWGMSGSPLVHDNRVIVTPGGKGSAAICYEALSGTELWRSGSDPGAYASPIVAQVCGKTVLLSFNGAGLRAYSADTGESLWLVPWLTQGEMQRVNVAQPIVIPGDMDRTRILLSSGYGQGTSLVEVIHRDGEWKTQELWHSIRLRSKMSNFVVSEDYIYGLDSGILTCLDLATGQRLWKKGRYGHGQMLLVDNKLLIQAETGEIFLVEATPKEHRELGRIDAFEGKSWNNLALAGDLLVVRNDHEAAAFSLPTKP